VQFEQFVAEKARRARAARIGLFQTEEDNSSKHELLSVGNDWTRKHYGGPFLMSPAVEPLPAVSLVFVRSREGNTVAPDPIDLGGGDTDRHLIYEGLSRVAADAVMAGARTAVGRAFFSIWHPDLVALRHQLGLPRHPAQVVVSYDGNHLDLHALLFNVPSVPVYVIAGPKCRERWGQLLSRPGITMIPTDNRDLTIPLTELRRAGLHRISAIGGRSMASTLFDAGLVQEMYLTTTLKSAGKPGTPFYVGPRRPHLELVLRKRLLSGRGEPAVQFEHLKVRD
jgi:riboflavin biosynthesis pyrimidine reductase